MVHVGGNKYKMVSTNYDDTDADNYGYIIMVVVTNIAVMLLMFLMMMKTVMREFMSTQV